MGGGVGGRPVVEPRWEREARWLATRTRCLAAGCPFRHLPATVGTVTDPITCPECGGSGEERYGPLTVACGFCSGLGELARREPAENADPPQGYGVPMWADAAVAALPGCHACLGAGVVVELGGAAGFLVTEPCPECSRPGG